MLTCGYPDDARDLIILFFSAVFIPCSQRSKPPTPGRPGYDSLSQLLSVRHFPFFPYQPNSEASNSWHRDGAYSHFTNQKDREILEAVRAFNPYDLYSKSDARCDPVKLRPYYEGLINKFFPPVLDW